MSSKRWSNDETSDPVHRHDSRRIVTVSFGSDLKDGRDPHARDSDARPPQAEQQAQGVGTTRLRMLMIGRSLLPRLCSSSSRITLASTTRSSPRA